MSKSKLFIIPVFLGLFLYGCQKFNPISSSHTLEPSIEITAQVVTSSATSTVNSLTPTIKQSVPPSPTSTVLPSQTPLPEPSSTQLPLEKLSERGLIWILRNDKTSDYTSLNLDNGEINSVNASDNCSAMILPGTEQVICGFPILYILHDLTTGEEQQLPIKDTCRFYGWSPNSRFLLYEYCTLDGSYKLATYDLVTQREQEVVSFSQPYDEREWNTMPLISYDGNHLIVGGLTVYEINQKTSERNPIGVSEPLTTWDIAFSPTANQVVYGTSDIEQEIGLKPNYLYIYDFDSGANSLLATAPEGKLYNWFFSNPIWSPDGSKVVVSSGSYLCVIVISSHQQSCHDLSPYNLLRFMTWSPGSQSIALLAGNWGDSVRDLVIFDDTNGSYFVLLSDLDLDVETLDILFWR